MAAIEKRRISARQILSEIRSGMDGKQLKQKHGLSHRSLESVLSKLAAAGLLAEAEIRRLLQPAAPSNDSPKPDRHLPAPQKCPACGTRLTSDGPECPVCGVVVAKFVARLERESLDNTQAPKGHMEAGKRWLLISCILAAVVVTGGGLWLLFGQESDERPGAVAESGRPQLSAKGLDQPGKTPGAAAEKDRKEKEALKTPDIFAMDTGQLLELTFASEGFPMGLSVTQGSGGVHFFETPDPNQGFRKFPPETDAKRYYDQLAIAGRTFLMLTDGTDPPKIYLDANRNGDMTDDPGPFVGEGANAAPNHYTLELPYKGEESPIPYRLWLFYSNMGGVRFYPKCYWEGQFELNGNTYGVVTFDGNSDGDYSNDPVIIDVDGNGKATDSERLRPGQSLTVDGTEVKLLAVAASGRWVRLEY